MEKYWQTIEQLKMKYGQPVAPYFVWEDSNWLNKTREIKRFKDEGLVIHHVDEITQRGLSTPRYAAHLDQALQHPSRLVYANVLEHLYLHYLIFMYDKTKTESISYLCGLLNDFYAGVEIPLHHDVAKDKVIKKFSTYVKIVALLVKNGYPMDVTTSINKHTCDNYKATLKKCLAKYGIML